MIASGGRIAAFIRASSAVSAVSTAYPAVRSLSWSARRICGSSSTTRSGLRSGDRRHPAVATAGSARKKIAPGRGRTRPGAARR